MLGEGTVLSPIGHIGHVSMMPIFTCHDLQQSVEEVPRAPRPGCARRTRHAEGAYREHVTEARYSNLQAGGGLGQSYRNFPRK